MTGSPLTFIEYVILQAGVTHYYRGAVTIELESPSGTISKLAEERPRDENEDYPFEGFKFVSVRHWGESQVNGSWKIRVRESQTLVPVEKQGRAFFNGYQITIYGA